MDLKFPRGRGDQVKKSWKFQGVGGNHVKPSGMENPGGWGLKLEKTLCGGGMDIFWNHIFSVFTGHAIKIKIVTIKLKKIQKSVI